MKATNRFIFLPALLLSACASKQDLVVVKDNLETMKTQSAGSYSDIQQLRDRVDRLQGSFEEAGYQNKQKFGNLGMEDSLLVHKVDELESRIRNIERYLGITPPPKPALVPAHVPASSVGASAEKKQVLAETARTVPSEPIVGSAVATAAVVGTQKPVAAAAPEAALKADAHLAASTVPSSADSGMPPLPTPPVPTDSDLFNEGAELFGKERFGLARERFTELIKTYPSSGLADDAQFFIAESWFNEGAYEKSILEYQTVIAKYTKSEKRPAALFKQARAFEQIGDTASAKIRYRDIVNVYPNSPEAKIAAGRK